MSQHRVNLLGGELLGPVNMQLGCTFLSLPPEVLHQILLQTTAGSRINLAETCKFASIFIYEDNRLWYTTFPAELKRGIDAFQSVDDRKRLAFDTLDSDELQHFFERPAFRRYVLGGPFDPTFNYCREVVGHWKEGSRCNNCFVVRDFSIDGAGPHKTVWGLTWCKVCLKEHTISHAMVLYACPAVAPYLQLARTMPGVVLGNRNTGYYYRPQVDELVRKLSDGDGLSALILKKEAQKQLIVNLHLDTSSMEARRRPVRWELIRCAKHFWEGKDPYPAPMHLQGADDDPMDGNRADVRPHPSTFRCFRTRFAPTKLLETFLFPPSSLVAKPSELPYNSAKGWLEDPSKELRHTNEFDGLTQEWYITKAYDMVDRLTNFHYVRYCKSGYGGFVDTWNKAAYEYHLSCLEHEVSVGNTLRLWDEDLQIERVKMELGIPDDAVGVPPGERATVAQLKSHNRHAPLIKIFNDLMRETCFVCPVTMSHFNPHGFKGLLDHVKNVHTKEYWTKNLSCVG